MIKIPVTYNSDTFVINDADTAMLIDLEVTIPRASDIVCGEYTDEVVTKMDSIGNQIVDALNTTADQSRVIEVMATMLNHIAEDHTDSWDNGWGYAESKRDMAIEALSEAKRIMEGK